jgi:hypothetical protein
LSISSASREPANDGGLAEHGFLSAETAGVVKVVERRYAAWLAIVRSVNTRAVRAQYEVQIGREYPPHLIAAAAYMRTLTNVQAAVLLLVRGLDVPARILLRASLESLFKLKAVERDPNVSNAIIAGDEVLRENIKKKFKRIDDPKLQTELERIIAEGHGSETVEKFKEWGIKALSVAEMAGKADLMPLYLSAYPVLSDSAHAGIRDLERHVETDASGQIVALRNEPCVDDLEVLFVMAAEFLILALEAHATIFKFSLNAFCDDARRELKDLSDAHRRG